MKHPFSSDALTRRRFVATAGGALASLAGGALGAPLAGRATGLPGYRDFAALAGERFGLPDGSSLRLATIESSAPVHPASLESYSLIFEGAPVAADPAIYSLRHPRLGTVDLFLHPVDLPDAGGCQKFEAVLCTGPVPDPNSKLPS